MYGEACSIVVMLLILGLFALGMIDKLVAAWYYLVDVVFGSTAIERELIKVRNRIDG